jgi:hypothetical protein
MAGVRAGTAVRTEEDRDRGRLGEDTASADAAVGVSRGALDLGSRGDPVRGVSDG